MKWLIATLIAPLLLWGALAPAAAFEGDTLKLGGDKGADFHDGCGAGEAVVGLYFDAGKDLDEVATICQAVQGQTIFGARRYLPARGGAAVGARSGDIACPEPMVVQSIHATQSGIRVVHRFRLVCRNLVTGETFATPQSRTNGGSEGGEGHADCGNDAYAIGTWGGYGTLIDAIGLTCATYHPAVVQTPPPPPPPPPPKQEPKPDKPPLKVDNGNQTSDNGGGATARTNSTVYDQPQGNDVGYLSAGDPVTIVGCNRDNWCQISEPNAGWVWGDDLKR